MDDHSTGDGIFLDSAGDSDALADLDGALGSTNFLRDNAASGEEVWSPGSWRGYRAKQLPQWANEAEAHAVEQQLAGFPPLVFAGEVDRLTERLGEVASGKSILLQGGDCAEAFAEHSANNIRDFLSVFLQMSAVLTYASGLPVVKVGRIAGQFAKPRSSDTETIDGVTLPSYRGDIVNRIEFSQAARAADPARQLEAYRQSASTLNLIRALCGGGYASLHNVHSWIRRYVHGSEATLRYADIADEISKAMRFIEACGITVRNSRQLASVSMYTSHEALLLGYEQSFTRQDSRTGKWYATSGHLLWIGDRTRQLDGAHVEYCRGIANPVGLKCGPSLQADDLIRLIDALNPSGKPGRLTLICRMGASEVRAKLPPLIRAVKAHGVPVAWCCDPMHGNTEKTESGYKTRRLPQIVSELTDYMSIHKEEGTWGGGVHLELTGKQVTECLGGAHQVTEQQLGDRYHTHCDPRLNANQSLDVVFELAELLSGKNQPAYYQD